jgi:hypothetical protein
MVPGKNAFIATSAISRELIVLKAGLKSCWKLAENIFESF